MNNTVTDQTHAISVNQLRAFIERIERLEEEKKPFLMILKMSIPNLRALVLIAKLFEALSDYAKKKNMNAWKKKPLSSFIKMRLV